MATLQTINDFREAITYLRKIDYFGDTTLHIGIGDTVAECEVLDDETLTILTPDTPTLETALDGALADMAAQETVASVQANAKAQAAAIPNWASWTEEEVLTWFDTNITNALPAANLAGANVVLGRMATAQRAMARMIVALRNAQYPDLQDG